MKSNIYKIISGILFPVAFVSLFFVIGGTEHGTTCWIGFASIILSYVMLIAVQLYITNSQSGTVTGIFFSVQFVIGLIFVICDFDKWKIALIIEMVLFVIMIFFTLQLFQTDEATAKKEVKHSQEVYSVKNLSLKAKMIFNSTTDIEFNGPICTVHIPLVPSYAP